MKGAQMCLHHALFYNLFMLHAGNGAAAVCRRAGTNAKDKVTSDQTTQ